MDRPNLKIVVPSKGRPKTWEVLNRLLPECVYCVDEREAEDYRMVPAERLVLHPPTTALGQVRNWIQDNFDADCIVQVDDDFTCVRPMIGFKRVKIVDPATIMQIITNSYQVCKDLGLSAFCYSMNSNPGMVSPMEPIKWVAPFVSPFGIIGKKIRFDDSLIHGEDVDMALKILLKDRVLLCDTRFLFDTGGFMQGEGGLRSMRTEARIQQDVDKLNKRWGRYVRLEKPRKLNWAKSAPTTNSINLVVARKKAGV